jgi:pimeloyl-ACP methyl ester carboxylesterase
MATFVLVHPAWFGGWCWQKLVPLLRDAGCEVCTPTLTGLGDRIHLATPEVGLATHIEDVVQTVTYADLGDVILVGNSSGGMVITGVADRVPERIANVVYLDAFVPHSGQSVVDILPPERRATFDAMVAAEGDGWLLPRFAPPPWDQIVPGRFGVDDTADVEWILARLAPTPYKHFTDPLWLRRADDDSPPRTYIRCSRFSNPAFDRFAHVAQAGAAWTSIEMDSGHVPYISAPDQLSKVLLALVP